MKEQLLKKENFIFVKAPQKLKKIVFSQIRSSKSLFKRYFYSKRYATVAIFIVLLFWMLTFYDNWPIKLNEFQVAQEIDDTVTDIDTLITMMDEEPNLDF